MAHKGTKPPELIGNLLKDGWPEVARKIYRRARLLDRLRIAVHVDNLNDVWVQTVKAHDALEATYLVAVYGGGAEINEIEDELIHHMRELSVFNERLRSKKKPQKGKP